MICTTSKASYESGQTVTVMVKLTGYERDEAEALILKGEFLDEPARDKISGLRANLDSEFHGTYYTNWTFNDYAREGTYYGQLTITVTAYNETGNWSSVIQEKTIYVVIVKPGGDGSGLFDFLPFDPLLLLGGLVGLIVLGGGGMITYRLIANRGPALPPPPSGTPLGGGLYSSVGGLGIAGAKPDQDDEEDNSQDKEGGDSKEMPHQAAAAGAALQDESRRKAKPQMGGKPSSSKPGTRPKPQRPSRPKSRPRRPAARPKPRSHPRPRAPPRAKSTPQGAPKPKPKGAPPKPKGAPPKPKGQSFHCPTDGTELQHWPDSGYESDYFCPKCELYVKPRESAGGGSSGGADSAPGEKREIACPGCHTVHEVTDPSVNRITCTCGRRIRV